MRSGLLGVGLLCDQDWAAAERTEGSNATGQALYYGGMDGLRIGLAEWLGFKIESSARETL